MLETCPTCGEKTLEEIIIKDYETKTAGVSIVVPLAQFERCSNCEEELFSIKEIKKWEKVLEHTEIQQQENLILQIELHIDKLMTEQNVSKELLAKRIGKSIKYVDNLFEGRNLKLREIADVFTALNSSLVVDTGKIGFNTTIKSKIKEEEEEEDDDEYLLGCDSFWE
jgi:YgiT-type zinc finger domain-containing protein